VTPVRPPQAFWVLKVQKTEGIKFLGFKSTSVFGGVLGGDGPPARGAIPLRSGPKQAPNPPAQRAPPRRGTGPRRCGVPRRCGAGPPAPPAAGAGSSAHARLQNKHSMIHTHSGCQWQHCPHSSHSESVIQAAATLYPSPPPLHLHPSTIPRCESPHSSLLIAGAHSHSAPAAPAVVAVPVCEHPLTRVPGPRWAGDLSLAWQPSLPSLSPCQAAACRP